MKPEILAPCGGADSFYAAVNAGADAVYLGLSRFSARKNAENFTAENIRYFISYAHIFGIKVYVCVNTLIKDGELEDFLQAASVGYRAGADAFIVQDIFLGKRLKNAFPDIALHLSTQAGVNNVDGAILAKEMGFSRAVLARETGSREIKAVSEIIETEVFVHGALCTSLSGHCYASSFIGGNSGNRGLCRQPCRQKYALSSDGEKRYALSLSDLCLADKVKELSDLGVSSFKIEGRMRSAEYVDSAVRLYRAALAGKDFSEELSMARRAFNRGNFCEGYAFGEDGNLLSDKVQGHLGELAAKVKKTVGDKIFTDKAFASGSGFKILRGGCEVGSAAAIADGCVLKGSGDIKAGDLVYLTKDPTLKLSEKRVKPVDVRARFAAGETPKLSALGIVVEGETPLEKAKSAPTTRADLSECLGKTDGLPFCVRSLDFSGGDAFILKSKLNALRKRFYNELFCGRERDGASPSEFTRSDGVSSDGKRALAVIVSDARIKLNGEFTEVVFAPQSYDQKEIDGFFAAYGDLRAEKFLYVPAFLTESEIKDIEKLSKPFDGLYAEGAFGLRLAARLGKKPFGGIELNVFNSLDALELQNSGVQLFCVSKELSEKEFSNLGGYVLALGSVKLMSLIYCPFKRNCRNCSVGGRFTLTDYGNRRFPVRRYATEKCRFEIFNESIIAAKRQFDKMIFDLSGLEAEFVDGLLADYFSGGFDEINRKYKHTSGKIVKGIL